MPTFETDSEVDIDVDRFLSACDHRDIEEIIEYLIYEEYISEDQVLTENKKAGMLEEIFIENMDKLKEKYYCISKEDEKVLEGLFQKYIF